MTQAPVVAVATDPFGKFVYTLGIDGTVTGFSVDTIYQDANEGALTQLGLATPIPGAMAPAGLAIDPSGNFLYETDVVTGKVTLLTINRATGAVTVGAGTAAGNALSVTVVGGAE